MPCVVVAAEEVAVFEEDCDEGDVLVETDSIMLFLNCEMGYSVSRHDADGIR